MRYFVLLLLAAAVSLHPAFAQQKRIVVERPATPPDTSQAPFHYEARTDSTPPRLVLDPGAMVYQERVDSINDVAEKKIRDAINQLEKNFQDPQVEDLVGRIIGTIVMEQQLALMDIQIDRALSLRDTLLLRGLELAFRELLINVPQLREALLQQVNALEQKFRELEIESQAVRRE
jgi:hypothetical protein